jgi:manganese/zinc/iron transport system permease protein
MMGLVVVVTVAGLQAVGLILVVAMLIVPPVAARFWTERLWVLVALAGLIGALSGYLGSVVSALLPRKPAGAVIVLTSGRDVRRLSFVAAPRGACSRRREAPAALRLRIGGDHLLEHGHDGRAGAAGRSTARRGRRAGARAGLVGAGSRGWCSPRCVVGDVSRRRAGRSGHGGGARPRRARRRNHALWEQYLVSYADIAPSHVDWSVDQVEHVLSDELVAELEAALAATGSSAGGRRPGRIGGTDDALFLDIGPGPVPAAGGVLAAVTCGLLGNFLVLRRLSLMGDAISHSVLPGLVIAFLITRRGARWRCSRARRSRAWRRWCWSSW